MPSLEHTEQLRGKGEKQNNGVGPHFWHQGSGAGQQMKVVQATNKVSWSAKLPGFPQNSSETGTLSKSLSEVFQRNDEIFLAHT